MDNFEFYKELYFKENDRRMEVQNSMNIPIAVITATASVVFYLITTMNYENGIINNCIFYVFMAFSNIWLLISIYNLTMAFGEFFKGYEYSSIPYVQQLYDWSLDLDKYFKDQGKTTHDAEQHFNKYIVENLIKHTDHNMYVNDQKFTYIFKSKKFLVFSMICTMLSIVPYFYSKFSTTKELPKPNQIDLVKIPEYLYLELNKINNSLNSIKYECKKSEADTTTTTTR